MKFSQIPYTRPDLEAFIGRFHAQLDEFRQSTNAEQAQAALRELLQLRNEFETMQRIAVIRYTLDTANAAFAEEQDFFDLHTPAYTELVNLFYQALLASPFQQELRALYGQQLFNIAAMRLNTFKPEIKEDLAKENQLCSAYTRLLASANIEFEGQQHNLSTLGPLMSDTNRDRRRRAHEAYFGFLAAHSQELDELYDQLVKLRAGIAQKLGFPSYTEYRYAVLNRAEYNPEMVALYREEVRQYVVPLAQQLLREQAARLGVDRLKYYDQPLKFKEGNPRPQGNAGQIVASAQQMYREMSPEIGEFFDFMIENELMDLEARQSKAAGGYCDLLALYKSPFVFANFNGTNDDTDTLTHEIGHAFQAYLSCQTTEVPEYYFPTYDACEIHSMSMEYLTHPWMGLFFGDKLPQFYYTHLSDAVLFLPYGVTVDEFQHFVYANPECSPEQRHQAWREIAAKYLPHLDYDGNAFLEKGAFWQRQSHIYQDPFYYIDYTLALFCALQLWQRNKSDRPGTWQDYLAICRAGGRISFLEMVALAKLKSPFEKGGLAPLMQHMEEELKQY